MNIVMNIVMNVVISVAMGFALGALRLRRGLGPKILVGGISHRARKAIMSLLSCPRKTPAGCRCRQGKRKVGLHNG